MPKISVVMPVYNSAKTLSRSVESILDQTFTDFEFIIVNEFESNDGSKEIVEKYAKQDKRVRLKQLTRHEGIANSLNIGIQLSQGEYIARMDADDYSYPKRLEKQINFLKNHREYVICGTYLRLIQEINNDSFVRRYPCTHDEIKASLLFDCPLGHPSVMFQRETFIKNRWLYNPMHRCEDYDLWTQVDGKMMNLPVVLVDYYVNENNSSIIHNDEVRKDTCEIIKAQLQRRMGIDVNQYDDSVFLLEMHEKGASVQGLILQGLKLLLEIESKNMQHKFCDVEALTKVLCRRWNVYLKEFYATFMDTDMRFPQAIYKNGFNFSEIVSLELRTPVNQIINILESRIDNLQSRLFLESKCIVFAAGRNAVDFFNRYPQLLSNIAFFSDNNSNLWGSKIFGIRIISPEDIIKTDFDWILISSSQYFMEIYTLLIEKYHIDKKRISDLSLLFLRQPNE